MKLQTQLIFSKNSVKLHHISNGTHHHIRIHRIHNRRQNPKEQIRQQRSHHWDHLNFRQSNQIGTHRPRLKEN